MNQVSSIVAKLKLKNNAVDFIVASLLIISLYLSIQMNAKITWILISIVLYLRIAVNWKAQLYVLLLLSLALLLNHFFFETYRSGRLSGNFKVNSIMSGGVVVKFKGDNVFIRTKLQLSLYDKIYASGDIQQFKNFSNFDYVSYMKSKNIVNQVPYSFVKVLSHSEDFRSKALDYFSNGPGSYPKVAPLMLLGKKTTESKPIYDEAFKMSIIHLFVISGFHISLFFVGFKKCLNLIGFKSNYVDIFCLIPIYTYLYLLSFPLSALRASLLITLMVINKVFLKNRFASTSLLCVIMITMFIFNRNVVYSVSYIFTFIATFVIMYINKLKFKNKWSKRIAIMLGAYLSNLPISIYLNGFFSIFGILYSAILSPVFVFMYGISMLLFPFKGLLSFVYGAFISMLDWLNSFNVLVNVNNVSLIITQSLYLIPLMYLIIHRTWNLSEAKKVT